MKRVLIGLAAVVLAAVLVLDAVLIAAGRDTAPPDTSDLALDHPEVAPDANACTYLNSATNLLRWPTNASVVVDYLDGKPTDEAAVARLVAENGEALAVLERASACRRCLAPEVSSFDALLPHLSPWRNMGRLQAAKARLDRRAGRYAGATDACLSLLRFGDLVQADPACMIQYLVGVAILELGITEARALACDARTPSADLERLSAGLSEVGPFAPGLIRAIKTEYWMADDVITRFSRGEFSLDDLGTLTDRKADRLLKGRRIPAYFFQPNRTRTVFAGLYRGAIADASLPYSRITRRDAELTLALGGDGLWRYLRPNLAGRMLVGVLMTAMDSLLERRCRIECAAAASRLAVAIARFRRDTGASPAELGALVPAYLEAVPADPYDGQPFRYLPSRGVVYSVGSDLRDSGGSAQAGDDADGESPAKRRWKGEDVVFDCD